MSNAMVLHGEIEDERDRVIADLRDEIADLRTDLSNARATANRAKRDVEHAVSALRTQLTPLYRALQAVFGDMDAIGGSEAPASVGESKATAVWDSWKSKFPGKRAAVIDALLLHGEMSTQQLAIAIGSHRNNVPGFIKELNKAGLIRKNGRLYALKAL